MPRPSRPRHEHDGSIVETINGCHAVEFTADLAIHIFHQTDDGWAPNRLTFQRSDFCGRIPSTGDFILDPHSHASEYRHDATEQTILEVLRTVYYPNNTNALVLLVSERSTQEDELDFVERLIAPSR